MAALGFGLWGVTEPSFWRDEAATAEVARRTVPQIFDLLGHIDAVHGCYYLLVHFFTAVAGEGEFALRLPSVLAGAVTAAGTAAIGRRLVSDSTGLIAGLLAAAAPLLIRYAQEARPYALETAAAVLATLLLLRALDLGRRRDWAAYGTAVVLLGLFNVFGLLLLAAHLITVGPRWRPWALTAGLALLPLLPLVLVTAGQRDEQVYWLAAPGFTDVGYLIKIMSGAGWLIAPMLLLAVVGATLPELRRVALGWLLLPTTLLIVVSLIHPLYNSRYVLFCVPALVLLAAGGLTRLPRPVPLLGTAALIAAMIPVHVTQHRQDDRADDLRALAQILRSHERKGDALLFAITSQRSIMGGYPKPFDRLNDLAVARTGEESGTLAGVMEPPGALAARLTGVNRVWLVSRQVNPNAPDQDVDAARVEVLRQNGFEKAKGWKFKGGYLSLYRRR